MEPGGGWKTGRNHPHLSPPSFWDTTPPFLKLSISLLPGFIMRQAEMKFIGASPFGLISAIKTS